MSEEEWAAKGEAEALDLDRAEARLGGLRAGTPSTVLLEADRQRDREAARRLIASEQASAEFSGFSGQSLKAALAEERTETPWLIDSLMRQGHKATLTAGFKTGKTTLTANLVRSMADGDPFLGRFDIGDVPGTVSVFDYELTTNDMLDMYERLGLRNPDRVHAESLRGKGFSLANDVHAEMAVNYLREHEAAFWVLDTHTRAMRGFGSENDNDDVGLFLHRVDKVAAEAGLLGVLLLVHTGRMEQEVGAERARGATRLDDDADARWIYTRERGGARFFRAEGRNQVGCDEFAVQFDVETGRLSATEKTRRSVRDEPLAEEAARIVVAADGPLKASELQGRMAGKDEKPKRAGIALAVTRGWITEAPGVRNSKLYAPGPVPVGQLQLSRPLVREGSES